MDSTKRPFVQHPRERASFLSVLFLSWTWSIFRKDRQKKIEISDIWSPVSSHSSLILGDRLERVWNEALKKSKSPNLMFALFKAFSSEIAWLALLHICLQLLDILLRPYFLGLLLSSFSDDGNQELTFYAAVGLISTSAVTTVMANQYNLNSFVLGLYLRAACVSLVYRKSLRLSRASRGEWSPGQVVNLVSNDVSRFEILALLVHFMWSSPLVAIVVGVFLWQEVGVACAAGLFVVFTVLPIQTVTARLTSKYRLQTAFKTDARIRATDEVISGITVIKMYAWERPIAKLLQAARKVEMAVIRKTGLLRGLYMTFNIFTTRCAVASTLIVYSLVGNTLKADKVFVVAAYFGIMSLAMSTMFVRGFAELAECKVSVGRLQTFLLHEEVTVHHNIANGDNSKLVIKEEDEEEEECTDKKNPPNGATRERRGSLQTDSIIAESRLTTDTKVTEKIVPNRLVVKDVVASWLPNNSDPTLDGITFTASNGLLLGVIGPVGCGKSSLLQFILGELSVLAGNMEINGSLSYAAQEPWVFAGTVRQNILFGQPMERKRYKEVVKVCALERDIELFSNGDLTVVGERGSSLSGGQKARINLARAVYRQADIYLLDDPLSAVDAHVSKHIFKYCLRGFLRGKTIILATHQLQFTRNMDKIIVMDHGRIIQQGSHEDIVDLTSIDGNQKKLFGDTGGKTLSAPKPSPSLTRMMSINSTRSVSSGGDDVSLRSFDEIPNEETPAGETHTRYSGSIYVGYMKCAGTSGIALFCMVVLFFIATQALASTTDYWMAYWTQEDESGRGYDMLMIVYASLVGALFLSALVRGITFYLACSRASIGLHTTMVNNVLGTNLSFFTNNHSGSILNRFSKDLGGTDEGLPKVLLDCCQIFGQVAGAMITSSIISFWFIIPVSIFTILTVVIRNICIKTTKNMKRIENMARSPVYSHLNSSLQGLVTIRAHGAQKFLMDEFDSHQDLHTSSLFTYLSLQQGYAFLLDIFGFIYLALVIVSFIYLQSGAAGSEVGLAITQTMTVTVMLQWGMRGSAELANLMTSVERLLGLTHLPPEDPDADKKEHAPADWPSGGEIIMKDVSLWYDGAENPSIHDLNITIRSGEKVGIVGRTGAGKSSIVATLLRLARVDGKVLVDGLNSASVPLTALRARIAVIPQEAALFSGTIRTNLDPFQHHPDYALWRAMEEVELKETLPEGLETPVSDSGANLSIGQRQLVCLARAVLRGSRIVILDEATANVDPRTDSLIQSTIRKRFGNCTVLTVAHRLQTVIDADRIIVMDAGFPVEFDEPYRLLQMKNGYFYHLVQETGNAMATQLTETALQVHLRRLEMSHD